jgi:hypothetical protein
MQLSRFRLALVTLALVHSSNPSAAQKAKRPEDLLPSIAATLGAYLEARAAGDELEGPRAALALSLAELAKARGGDPLQHAADLGRVLRSTRTYPGERGGKVQTGTFTQGSFAGAGLSYAYRLPREYDPSSTYALILAIPGEGEQPADHIRANWTDKDVQDQVILLCPAMPAQSEAWEHVMVKGRPGGLCHVLTGLRIAVERFSVDSERVYVAGLGKGVPAAIAAGNYSPQRFAGIIARAGEPGSVKPDNFSNLPIFFAGGSQKARTFAEACHASSQFRHDGNEHEILKWMRTNPRRTYPERVLVVPGDPEPYPTRAYWLQVKPGAASPRWHPEAKDIRASATLDRATNTVVIEAKNIAQVTLLLNDLLIDLAKPIKVVANGVEHNATVPRQFTSFVDMLYDGISDPGVVYVARLELDLTGDSPPAGDVKPEVEAEFARFLAAAGDEVGKLWELHLWCVSAQLDRHDARVLRTILRLDPGHALAHQALGHVFAAGQWFSSSAALERFQLSQDPAVAAARGWVEYRSLWLHPDEKPFAVKGWTKDQETGQWLTPGDKKKLAEGWVRQDLEWIHPADAVRVDEGMWWVDGEWLDLAQANRRHASVDALWRIPSAEVLLHSTADREVSLRAMREMARALVDLGKVFGVEPVLPLRVGLLRDEEQYDRFAFGDPDGRRLANHAGRLQVVHSAYFAESCFRRVARKWEYLGMGVCYWDTRIPNGDAYGVHAARLAAGLSYVDAIDPSPNAVKKALASGPGPEHYAAYEAEKKLPAWLRWGGAVYAERYFQDTTVGPDGDPWWTRKWSLDNLQQRGGLRPFEQIIAFQLQPDDREDALKMYIEAGLLVAFLVDGNCAPVTAEHAALKKALAAGRVDAQRVTALTEALRAHWNELRAFAGPGF